MDGPLIKLPEFPDIYTLQMFNPSLYCYLQFECINGTPEPNTEETAYRQRSSSEWYFSNQDPL